MKKTRKLACMAVALLSMLLLFSTAYAEVISPQYAIAIPCPLILTSSDANAGYEDIIPAFTPATIANVFVDNVMNAFQRQFAYDGVQEYHVIRSMPVEVANCTTMVQETGTVTAKPCTCSTSHAMHHTSTGLVRALIAAEPRLAHTTSYGFVIDLSSHPLCVESDGECKNVRGSAKTTLFNGQRWGVCVIRKRDFSHMSDTAITIIHEIGHVFGANHHTDSTICVMNTNMSKRPELSSSNHFCATCAPIVLANLNSSRLATIGENNPSAFNVWNGEETICDIEEEVVQQFSTREALTNSLDTQTMGNQRTIYEWIEAGNTLTQEFVQTAEGGSWSYRLPNNGVVTLSWYEYGNDFAARRKIEYQNAVEKGIYQMTRTNGRDVYCNVFTLDGQEVLRQYYWEQDGIWFTLQSAGTQAISAENCSVTRIFCDSNLERE